MRQTAEPNWRRVQLLCAAIVASAVIATANQGAPSPGASYAGCYRLAFTAWPPSSPHRPALPPAEVELARSVGDVSDANKVIPLFDPSQSRGVPQFTYWKRGESGELVIVWGTGLSGVAMFLRRSGDGVLRGTAEIVYDDGGRYRSEASATPALCGTMP